MDHPSDERKLEVAKYVSIPTAILDPFNAISNKDTRKEVHPGFLPPEEQPCVMSDLEIHLQSAVTSGLVSQEDSILLKSPIRRTAPSRVGSSSPQEEPRPVHQTSVEDIQSCLQSFSSTVADCWEKLVDNLTCILEDDHAKTAELRFPDELGSEKRRLEMRFPIEGFPEKIKEASEAVVALQDDAAALVDSESAVYQVATQAKQTVELANNEVLDAVYQLGCLNEIYRHISKMCEEKSPQLEEELKRVNEELERNKMMLEELEAEAEKQKDAALRAEGMLLAEKSLQHARQKEPWLKHRRRVRELAEAEALRQVQQEQQAEFDKIRKRTEEELTSLYENTARELSKHAPGDSEEVARFLQAELGFAEQRKARLELQRKTHRVEKETRQLASYLEHKMALRRVWVEKQVPLSYINYFLSSAIESSPYSTMLFSTLKTLSSQVDWSKLADPQTKGKDNVEKKDSLRINRGVLQALASPEITEAEANEVLRQNPGARLLIQRSRLANVLKAFAMP